MCSGGVETQNDLKGGKAERAGCMPASHVKKKIPSPFPTYFCVCQSLTKIYSFF